MIKLHYLTLIGILVLLTNPSRSQTMIAVQNETNSTFYASLDSAITYAKSGDYVYLPGGVFTISVPISKQLQIVGVGHNPDSCAATGITQVVGTFTIKNGSDRGSISGLRINGDITFSATVPQLINYFLIERCNFGNLTLASQTSNILVNECVIHGSITGGNQQSTNQGFQLSKCFIDGAQLMNFSKNTYFINNIFNGSYLNSFSFININNCYFRNNIFLKPILVTNSWGLSQNNIFQNNFFLDATPLSSAGQLYSNITGSSSTIFKNQSDIAFDYKQDYHILNTSPAHNAGTDGTDLGIYGTSSPWKEGSLPANPHIQSKSISTVNGNLNLKIKAAAQDH